MPKDTPYDDSAIGERLDALPGWCHADGAIARTYKTSGWRATLMVVTTVGHLCEAAWHHPDLVVGYDTVTVRLSTHSAKGVTDRDFELAAQLDAVIGWRPSGGALTGPPASKPYVID